MVLLSSLILVSGSGSSWSPYGLQSIAYRIEGGYFSSSRFLKGLLKMSLTSRPSSMFPKVQLCPRSVSRAPSFFYRVFRVVVILKGIRNAGRRVFVFFQSSLFLSSFLTLCDGYSELLLIHLSKIKKLTVVGELLTGWGLPSLSR